jgi:hypothetical protein
MALIHLSIAIPVILVLVLFFIGIPKRHIAYCLTGISGLVFIYYCIRGDVSGPCTYIKGWIIGLILALAFLSLGFCTLFLISAYNKINKKKTQY